jgi:hypothetical protein
MLWSGIPQRLPASTHALSGGQGHRFVPLLAGQEQLLALALRLLDDSVISVLVLAVLLVSDHRCLPWHYQAPRQRLRGGEDLLCRLFKIDKMMSASMELETLGRRSPQ